MLFIRLQHRYCRKLKKCLDQQWNYYKSHNFAPPIKRSKGADFRHDIKKYAVVELGMAIDATQKGGILEHFGTPVWTKKMPKTLVLSILVQFGTVSMRRERDSNPRYPYEHTTFPG